MNLKQFWSYHHKKKKLNNYGELIEKQKLTNNQIILTAYRKTCDNYV